MTTLEDALRGVTVLGLDTAPVIYFVEAHPQYDARVTAVFQQIASGTLAGITSIITLSEVLVQPLVHQHAELVQEYRDLLLNSAGFQTRAIDAAVAEHAAALRAEYRIRLPDALQIAAALAAGCQAFLTNDLALRRVTTLRVLVLDELEL